MKKKKNIYIYINKNIQRISKNIRIMNKYSKKLIKDKYDQNKYDIW